MLPAQDSLSDNSSLGNLIALPLQGKALQDGNSAFIDGNWNAYPDQWRILFSKPRLSQEFLEEKIKEWTNPIEDVAANAAESDREKPWNRMQHFNKNDVDGKIHITLSNKELTKYDNGILHAATAFGKTVVSSAIIAQKKVNTLIILESSALIEQWKDALGKFINISEELPTYETKTGRVRKRKSLIGTLQGAHDSMTGIIDIAMAGSLCKKGSIIIC